MAIMRRMSTAVVAREASRLRPWPRIARAAVRAALRLLFRIRLQGSPPAEGPYLLIANHQGWVDAFLLLALFPAEPRIHFIADRSATMTIWWKRLLLRSLGVVVPVARDGGSERSAIATALRLLEEGAVVAVFPEGRVSRVELETCPACLDRGRDVHVDHERQEHRRDLAPFERGIGYLALKARVPVLPVWLRGTAELYVGRELIARVGELAPPPAVPPTKEATQKVAAALHDELSRIALPLSGPIGAKKRWRWLTHLF